MSRFPTVQEWAKITQAGYVVRLFSDHTGGYELLGPEGANLMIGNYGYVAPTQYEAVAEALCRIEQDELLTAEIQSGLVDGEWFALTPEEALAFELDESIPEDHRTITVGDLRRIFDRFPDSFPVTVLKPGGGWWLNVTGATKADGEQSVQLVTRDDFDTRQW